MNLLLVRHGKAGDHDEWIEQGKSDFDRPLTSKGREEMKDIASRLAKFAGHFDRVVTSPFVRTVQTAEILAKEFDINVESLDALAYTSGIKSAVDWLGKQKEKASLILVGHEPTLSQLAEALLTGRTDGFLAFKKGGSALLTCHGSLYPGSFHLEWLLQP